MTPTPPPISVFTVLYYGITKKGYPFEIIILFHSIGSRVEHILQAKKCHASHATQSSILLNLFYPHHFPPFSDCKWRQKFSNTQLTHQIKWWVLILLLNNNYLFNLQRSCIFSIFVELVILLCVFPSRATVNHCRGIITKTTNKTEYVVRINHAL